MSTIKKALEGRIGILQGSIGVLQSYKNVGMLNAEWCTGRIDGLESGIIVMQGLIQSLDFGCYDDVKKEDKHG